MNSDDFVLIHDHIIECRGRGHCLPQTEIDLIQSWMVAAAQVEDVILALDDFLPKLFSGPNTTVPPSLRRIDKKVRSRLLELQQRQAQL